MYNIGDIVVYGETGVCRVAEIVMRDFFGSEENFYKLCSCYHECTVYIPVNNTKNLRSIITAEEANSLINLIPDIQAKPYISTTIRDVEQKYKELLKSYECRDLIELTMSIYTKKQTLSKLNKKIAQMDEKYLKRAELLLFSELGTALDIKPEDVPKYIENRIACIKNEDTAET